LQLGEFGGHGRGDELRLGGHGLPELDEHAASILEGAPQRTPKAGGAHLGCIVGVVMEQAPPDHDPADLRVADGPTGQPGNGSEYVREAPWGTSLWPGEQLDQDQGQHREHRH
jgi:hypothetical protein